MAKPFHWYFLNNKSNQSKFPKLLGKCLLMNNPIG